MVAHLVTDPHLAISNPLAACQNFRLGRWCKIQMEKEMCFMFLYVDANGRFRIKGRITTVSDVAGYV